MKKLDQLHLKVIYVFLKEVRKERREKAIEITVYYNFKKIKNLITTIFTNQVTTRAEDTILLLHSTYLMRTVTGQYLRKS